MRQRILKDMRRRRADATSANKLVWVAGTIVVVLFVTALSYSYYGNHGAARTIESSAAQALAVAYTSSDINEKDTDGDGVPDWEEVLWNTDASNADTDGDGTPDGKESRTLLVPSLDGVQEVSPGGFSATSSNLTQTAARELLGAYMVETRKANVDLSEEEQDALVQQTIQTTAAKYVPPTLNESDLTIVSATPEVQVQYVIDVAALITELGSRSTNDYALMTQLSGENAAQAAATLKESASQTLAYVQKMKGLSVPDDAVVVHIDLVSSLLGYGATVENIASLQEDPMRAVVGMQMLVAYDQLLQDAADAFMLYGDSIEGTS